MPAFIDHTGQKIGRLLFLSCETKKRKVIWSVQCECGKVETVRTDRLAVLTKKGKIFECAECRKQREYPVIVGDKYGRWEILGKAPSQDNHHTFVRVRCECGTEKDIKLHTLTMKRKPSKSCGCYARKIHSKWVNTTQYPPSHGFKSGKSIQVERDLYNTRNRMVAMCYNPKHISYQERGGNGYTVCDLWRNGATDFYKWAKELGYEKGDCLCIKEGHKEYSPDSCFLMKKGDYFRDKNSIYVTYKGKTLNLSEWAKEKGVTSSALSARIKRYGIEEALSSEWKVHRNQIYGTEHFESEIIKRYQQGYTFHEITRDLGCQISTIYRFLRKNNIQTRPQKTKSAVALEKRKGEIVKEVNSVGLTDASKNLGIHYSTLRYHFKNWTKTA